MHGRLGVVGVNCRINGCITGRCEKSEGKRLEPDVGSGLYRDRRETPRVEESRRPVDKESSSTRHFRPRAFGSVWPVTPVTTVSTTTAPYVVHIRIYARQQQMLLSAIDGQGRPALYTLRGRIYKIARYSIVTTSRSN